MNSTRVSEVTGAMSESSLSTASHRSAVVARRGNAGARRGRIGGAGSRARGFTLIEITIAFTVLALGLGIAMQIATGAMRNARVAAERTEAALYAQSMLDGAGVGERLELGQSSGDFNDDFRWTLTVEEHEVVLEDAQNGIDPSMAPVQLYRLELVVTWGRERQREQEARFVTLRALTPDTAS